MPSNDEVVFGIPSMQCPSCGQLLDLSGKRIEKFTKQQRKEIHKDEVNFQSKSYTVDPFPTGEDTPTNAPEKNYIVVSCENHRCNQYNKIKIVKIPRLYTPSVKVDLND